MHGFLIGSEENTENWPMWCFFYIFKTMYIPFLLLVLHLNTNNVFWLLIIVFCAQVFTNADRIMVVEINLPSVTTD